VVELPEHTGATMACVLQYLYTGHACFSSGGNEVASKGAAAQTPPATAAVPAGAGSAEKPTAVWQLLRSVPYFQGLSDHDPVALVPLVMVAADQLQLPDLHEACLQLAQTQLSPKTALPWLLAAHMGRQEAVEKVALQYVVDNMAGVWTTAQYACVMLFCTNDCCRSCCSRCRTAMRSDQLHVVVILWAPYLLCSPLLLVSRMVALTFACRCCGALASLS
jgi:hypothetical protein